MLECFTQLLCARVHIDEIVEILQDSGGILFGSSGLVESEQTLFDAFAQSDRIQV